MLNCGPALLRDHSPFLHINGISAGLQTVLHKCAVQVHNVCHVMPVAARFLNFL